MREGNEDSYLIANALHLFAVADGMGGHRAGEVASHAALGALLKVLNDDPAMELTDAVVVANDAVYQMAVDDPSLQGMGTTLTAVRIDGASAWVGHVGDSRAYLLRDGQLVRVTEDHSFVDQLRREGRITDEQAASHPQRSILTRALGIEPGVSVDPGQIDLFDRDRLLLCSDGLHALVRDPAILAILRQQDDPQQAAEALVAAANAAGGDDNITAVIIDVHDDDGEAHARAVTAGETVESTADSQLAETIEVPPVEMLPPTGPELDATMGGAATITGGSGTTGVRAAEADSDGAGSGTGTGTGSGNGTGTGSGTSTVGPPPAPGRDGRRRRMRFVVIPLVVVAAAGAAIAGAVIASDDDESPTKPALTSASAPLSTTSLGPTSTTRSSTSGPSATTAVPGAAGSSGSSETGGTARSGSTGAPTTSTSTVRTTIPSATSG
jgi:serine/threonine protein phosphatase PrpC